MSLMVLDGQAALDDEVELFFALKELLSDKKSEDVLLIDVQSKHEHCTHILIATALSGLHLKSLAEESIRFVRSRGGQVLHFNIKEYDTGWAIIDMGDLILHLFLRELRERYNLEELYAIRTRGD